MIFKKYLIMYKINLEINKIIISDQCNGQLNLILSVQIDCCENELGNSNDIGYAKIQNIYSLSLT